MHTNTHSDIHVNIHATVHRDTLSKSILFFWSLFLLVNKIDPENTIVLIFIKAMCVYIHVCINFGRES